MNIHTTEHQIQSENGVPISVVVPYDDYLRMMAKSDDSVQIPHKVVGLHLQGHSLVRAWREYLGLTQVETARRMEISQSAYAQMEKPEAKLRPSTLQKIANAFGVEWEQLTED